MSTSPLKNVVVVGASTAGAMLARRLESKLPSTHRMVVIDANEFGSWPLSAHRAAVVPGWEHKTYRSFENFFSKDSRHAMLASTKVVELGNGSIKVDVARSEFGFTNEISFDICILALGSTYNFPFRPSSGTLSDAKAALVEGQLALKNTQHNIVVVGGGPVGVEYAGEIISQYPDKKVTIIQRSNRLLRETQPVSLGNSLQQQLEAKGVRIVFGESVAREVAEAGKGRVALSDGTLIEADLIINATGVKPNNSLISSTDPSVLDSSGFINVDKHLRILTSSPTSPFSTSTYFAIGDCANNEGGARAHKADNDASKTVLNILATISSQPLVPVGAPTELFGVALGPYGGSLYLPWLFNIVVGPWLALKGRGLLVFMFDRLYGKQTA